MGQLLDPPGPRISGVQMMRFQELNENGEIAIATGIIVAKRKGGINASVIQSESRIFGLTDYQST